MARIWRIFLTCSFDQLIDTINLSVYQWVDGHRSEKAFMINCQYYRSKLKKSLTDGSITWMKMRPKVSMDNIDRYHRDRYHQYRYIADCAQLCLWPTWKPPANLTIFSPPDNLRPAWQPPAQMTTPGPPDNLRPPKSRPPNLQFTWQPPAHLTTSSPPRIDTSMATASSCLRLMAGSGLGVLRLDQLKRTRRPTRQHTIHSPHGLILLILPILHFTHTLRIRITF